MVGYSCKQLSDDDVVAIESLFLEHAVVWHRNNCFVTARTFVELMEGKMDKDIQLKDSEILVKLVSQKQVKFCRKRRFSSLSLAMKDIRGIHDCDEDSYLQLQ